MLPFFGLLKDVVVLGAVLMLVVIAAFSTVQPEPEISPAAEEPVATTTAETIAEPTPVPKPEKPKPIEAQPVPVPAQKPPETTPLTLDEAIQSITDLAQGQAPGSVNDRTRAALVNIICTTDAAGSFNSVSGSGVLIDPRGVIITNAHVAQFLLLKDYPAKDFVECVVRTGSPARPQYYVELMFIPPSWIRDNAGEIDDQSPTGTGERDYALLRIAGVTGPSVERPASFPFLLVSLQPPAVGDDVLQAGYAAGFLGGITIQNDLYASSAWTRVRDVFTFNANTVDLFSLGGSVVAQSGSSGGPVVNTDGTLVGLIVTNTGTGDTSTRDLHALATSYIIRDFESERGKTLQSVLSTNNLAAEVAIYNQIFAPSARAALIAELEK